ncbi:hypothetical protein HMPREF1992_01466 [Selenomonas sp. oral taxon 892 str. F0426]|nr:hypothetical protein HMPREF1992_01466 [Selenomonas sp. oral taxon 892 str. F0426]
MTHLFCPHCVGRKNLRQSDGLHFISDSIKRYLFISLFIVIYSYLSLFYIIDLYLFIECNIISVTDECTFVTERGRRCNSRNSIKEERR